MNAVMDCIFGRRSVRSFTDAPIERETLMQIAEAAQWAPSAQHKETWKFTVTCDKDKMARLAKAIALETGRDPETYNLYKPAALILASNEKDNPNGLADCSCALENIFLAAHSLGIGSVWINQLQNICDDPKIRAELTALGIPADHVVYGLAALGYPDDVKSEKARIGKVVVVE